MLLLFHLKTPQSNHMFPHPLRNKPQGKKPCCGYSPDITLLILPSGAHLLGRFLWDLNGYCVRARGGGDIVVWCGWRKRIKKIH